MKRQKLVPDTERRAGRRLQIVAAAAAGALLVGFVLASTLRSRASDSLAEATARQAEMAPAVAVTKVEPAPSHHILSLPGETAAWFESTIYARVDGYVSQWFVDIGDQVKEGEVLAVIETPRLDARLAAAQARLNADKAEVQVRHAEAKFARTTYDRWKNSPNGVVSEQEREDKKAGFESTQARLNAAQSQVELAQAEVDRLAASEQFKQVRAPFAGTIVQRRIDIGNLVTAGSTTGTTHLYRITRNDPIRVFVDAPQAAADSMKDDTPVQIFVNNQHNRPFAGRITRTARALDPRARTLRVEIDLPNPDGILIPGLYVRAQFHLDREGTAQVPAAALVLRTAGPQVAVVTGDGTVQFRAVSISRDDGNTVELASGVVPGDRVVLNISNQIVDGEKVRPVAAGSTLVSADSIPSKPAK
jgi:RND family efflux transporter MFP subunit